MLLSELPGLLSGEQHETANGIIRIAGAAGHRAAVRATSRPADTADLGPSDEQRLARAPAVRARSLGGPVEPRPTT